jgi:hypothetical protein
MPDIVVSESLQITKGSLSYSSAPRGFTASMAGGNGPSPGFVVASTSGTTVVLTSLKPGGMCWMQNLDPTNFIEVGVYAPDVAEFIPVMELLPGEHHRIRLSRYLGQEFGSVPGTGSTGHGVLLQLKGVGGPCSAIVEAFDA